MNIEPYLEICQTQQSYEKSQRIFVVVPFSCREVVYQWHPLVVGELAGGQWREMARAETPGSFKAERGSSPGVWHGGRIWFLTHIASHRQVLGIKTYSHRFVVVDPETLGLHSYSLPFALERARMTEFAVGFDIRDGHFVLAYSVHDRSAVVVRIPAERVYKMMVPYRQQSPP
jgi:hypothetical protein